MGFNTFTRVICTSLCIFVNWVGLCSCSVELKLVRPLSAGTDNDRHHLQIREIEVFDNNGNELTLSIINYDSQSSLYPAVNSIDGNLNSMFITYWPEDITKDHFISFKVNGINSYCDIDYIKIYNRNNPNLQMITSRIVGSYLDIIENDETIDTFNINQDLQEYQFSMNELNTYHQNCLQGINLMLVRPLSAGYLDNDWHHLQIREIKVFDTQGKELILSINDYDSQATSYPATNAIDGNLDTMFITYWPEDLTRNHFISFRVNGINNYCNIGSIVIYNRIGSTSSRIVGSYLNVFDNGETIGTFNINQDLQQYEFNINELSMYQQDCKDCSVLLYSGLNELGTAWGPFDVGTYTFANDFTNDVIKSVVATANQGFDCSVTLYTHGGSSYTSYDYETFDILSGEKRYFDALTEPDDFKDVTNFNVWTSTSSQVSTIVINSKKSCPTFATCKVWGDPHFTTFDGLVHHFQGRGYFDYLKQCDFSNNNVNIPIVITGRQDQCRAGSRASCMRQIIVTIKDASGDVMISYPRGGKNPVFIDNNGVATGSAEGTRYYTDANGDNIELIIKDNSFEATFVTGEIKFRHVGASLVLDVSDCLSDYICGLCGTLDDDATDDFTRCDNYQVMDISNYNVGNYRDRSSWDITNEFGETCCRKDFDLSYLGTTDCIVDTEPPSDECTDAAEDICREAANKHCQWCDSGEVEDLISSCEFDVCLDSNCADIETNNFDYSTALGLGCLNTIVEHCENACPAPSMEPTSVPTLLPTVESFSYSDNIGNLQYAGVCIYPESYTWLEANKYCEDTYGTSLASIHSDSDDIAYKAARVCPEYGQWTGLQVSETNKGNIDYIWSDGSNYDYSLDWWQSAPSDGSIDLCVFIHGIEINKYHYQTCLPGRTYGFVCWQYITNPEEL